MTFLELNFNTNNVGFTENVYQIIIQWFYYLVNIPQQPERRLHLL